MKKFIIAALAASILATPAMAAPNDRHDGRGRYEQGHNDRKVVERRVVTKKVVVRHNDRRPAYAAHRWQRGQHFESRYARNYRVIATPRQYRLYDAPRGYHWVQSGNDAVLVGLASGVIAAVLANAIG